MKLLLSSIALLVASLSMGQTAAFFASDTVGCSPLTISFTNTSSGASNYFWDFGDGLTSAVEDPTHTFYGSNDYEVWLYAYQGASVDSHLLIIKVPAVLPNLSADEDVCPGSLALFTQSNNYESGRIVSWDFDDGYTASGEQVSHAFSALGTYNVIMTFQSPGCGLIRDSIEVSVNNDVYPSVHIHPESANDSICLGEAFPWFYDEDKSILWEFGDGNSSTDPYPTHYFEETGIYQVTISLTNECGNSTVVDSLIHVVSDLPPVAAMSGNLSNACPGDDVTLYAFTGDQYEYVWDIDGTTHVGPQWNGTMPAQTVTVTLSVTNACGLRSTETMYYTPNTNKTPPNWMAISRDSVCPFEPFYVSSIPGQNEYLWVLDDVDTSYVRGFYDSLSLGWHYYDVTITNNCGNIGQKRDSIFVQDDALPVANFHLNKASYCIDEQITFVPENASDFASVAWHIDGQLLTATTTTFSFSAFGSYDVSLVVTNYCGSTDSIDKTVIIDSLNAPNAMFTVTDWVCPNTEMQFTNQSSDTLSPSWDFGNGDFSTDVHPLYSYSIPGNYFVFLTVENACGNQGQVAQLITVSGFESDPQINELTSNYEYGDTACFVNLNFSLDHYWVVDGDSVWSDTLKVEVDSLIHSIALFDETACGVYGDQATLDSLTAPVTPDGIAEYASRQLTVFPNPTQQLLHVQNIDPSVPLLILDLTGRLLVRDGSPSAKMILNLDLPTGTYLLTNGLRKQLITKR